MKLILFFTLLALNGAYAVQSIEEKKASAMEKREGSESEMAIGEVNLSISHLRKTLEERYALVAQLHQRSAKEEEYRELLHEVKGIKAELVRLESRWRETAVAEAKKEEEGYALWDQEDTTLGQLIVEYGSMDYLYIVPPEMATVKLHMHSSIPIPRESWSEVLEIILAHNGIGVKKLNPYSRQLFVFKQDPSSVNVIAARQQELQLAPSGSRVFYVFSPPIEQVKSSFQFFERFADGKQTFAYQVSSKIALVGIKEEIEKLLTIYRAVWEDSRGKVARVVPVTKITVKEMEKILQAFFGEAIEKARAPFGKIENEGLGLFPLGQGSLILMGQQEVVERAERVVRETEDQLQDPAEMTVFLYHCMHSNPDDLAKVLERVYISLLTALPPEGGREIIEASYAQQGLNQKAPDGYASAPPLVVAPPPLKPGGATAEVEIDKGSDHFIPDPKTGTLLMVVRRDTLTKIKDLLRKLDVPKKMVQIEVLLFEKKLNQQSGFGLNLLRVGNDHNGALYTSLNFPQNRTRLGVLDFFFRIGGGHPPPFDFAYSFFMTQEDIQLNAAPSVITVNQTPATISIVEEISIDNGASPVQASNGTIVYQNSFTRAQYGITIVLTPIVHPPEEGKDCKGFITLQTNVTFDTPRPSADNKPRVDRRHIENEVRVVDGQTVILGGLRKKSSIDSEDKVPLLGEIPGIGKLFGSTKLMDDNTEMFIFITPKIISDPEQQLLQVRTDELKKRPGDIPEFLEGLNEAIEKERSHYFQQSLKLLWNH